MRTESYKKPDDRGLILKVKEILNDIPTYGYRRITAFLKKDAQNKDEKFANHKRIYRVMKQNGLLMLRPKHRIKKAHDGKVQTLLSNTRWCSDAFCIQCFNGEKVFVAFSLDTCDREAMRYVASTIGIDGKAIRDLMVETVEHRFGVPFLNHSIQWLTDNGSCYTAKETVNFGKKIGLDIRTTLPYSPESNGMAESFVKTFKRDYVSFGDLSNAKTVVSQLNGWFQDYNERAPHKALNMLSPREFLEEQKRAC